MEVKGTEGSLIVGPLIAVVVRITPKQIPRIRSLYKTDDSKYLLQQGQGCCSDQGCTTIEDFLKEVDSTFKSTCENMLISNIVFQEEKILDLTSDLNEIVEGYLHNSYDACVLNNVARHEIFCEGNTNRYHHFYDHRYNICKHCKKVRIYFILTAKFVKKIFKDGINLFHAKALPSEEMNIHTRSSFFIPTLNENETCINDYFENLLKKNTTLWNRIKSC